jgi:hypothetical protein
MRAYSDEEELDLRLEDKLDRMREARAEAEEEEKEEED